MLVVRRHSRVVLTPSSNKPNSKKVVAVQLVGTGQALETLTMRFRRRQLSQMSDTIFIRSRSLEIGKPVANVAPTIYQIRYDAAKDVQLDETTHAWLCYS